MWVWQLPCTRNRFLGEINRCPLAQGIPFGEYLGIPFSNTQGSLVSKMPLKSLEHRRDPTMPFVESLGSNLPLIMAQEKGSVVSSKLDSIFLLKSFLLKGICRENGIYCCTEGRVWIPRTPIKPFLECLGVPTVTVIPLGNP